MDYKEPKTRRELKGLNKDGKQSIYSQKHVRRVEALMEKREAAGAVDGPSAKKSVRN
jgi:hypothetical protein